MLAYQNTPNQAPPRQLALLGLHGVAAPAIGALHSSLRFCGEDAPVPLASIPESAVLLTDVFYRLVVSRDASGVVHYAVNGKHSHSMHNGDAANGASPLSLHLNCADDHFHGRSMFPRFPRLV
jgi:hypothetical protein